MTEGRERNRRAGVRITVSSMIQCEEHRHSYAHRQQTALSVDVQQDTRSCEVSDTQKCTQTQTSKHKAPVLNMQPHADACANSEMCAVMHMDQTPKHTCVSCRQTHKSRASDAKRCLLIVQSKRCDLPGSAAQQHRVSSIRSRDVCE